MRQAGVIAAAGLEAVRNNYLRLRDVRVRIHGCGRANQVDGFLNVDIMAEGEAGGQGEGLPGACRRRRCPC